MNLYISLFSLEDSKRIEEIQYCLDQNIQLDFIKKIFIFDEGFNGVIPQSRKIEIIPISDRSTFKTFFSHFRSDEINIIANSDIAFSNSIFWARLILRNEIFCLTRYEGNGDLFRKKYFDSQDVWIIRGKPEVEHMNLSFHMGIPGCDSVLAYEFYKNGFLLTNPSKLIITRHVHSSENRSYNEKDRMLQPYLIIRPVHIIGLFFSRLIQKILIKYRFIGIHFWYDKI